MHAEPLNINIDEVIRTEPIRTERLIIQLMWFCVIVGGLVFSLALATDDPAHLWGVFYINLVFWMGLACGGVMISAIVQIVRATWSSPVRRIMEANVAFLPFAFFLFLCTYCGKEYLFTWAREPMPGREWWMEPDFVYTRFALLFGFLFFMMRRYVVMSLRGDLGLVKETLPKEKRVHEWPYTMLTKGWKGSAVEVPALQNQMSWNAPLLVVLYIVIYSLFAFEMIMGMSGNWISNLYGGFIFLGNIYVAFAMTAMLASFFAARNPAFRKVLSTSQLWDLGKLTFGFCMLWGYTFFGQFLVQWYGNLPEETQWLILRTREFPWKDIGWLVFTMCFVFPFITLAGEDLKKNPATLSTVCLVIFIGIWLEKYIVIMPEISPAGIPFGIVEVGLFLGFLGVYALSIFAFMGKFPYIPVSHPQTQNRTDW